MAFVVLEAQSTSTAVMMGVLRELQARASGLRMRVRVASARACAPFRRQVLHNQSATLPHCTGYMMGRLKLYNTIWGPDVVLGGVCTGRRGTAGCTQRKT